MKLSEEFIEKLRDQSPEEGKEKGMHYIIMSYLSKCYLENNYDLFRLLNNHDYEFKVADLIPRSVNYMNKIGLGVGEQSKRGRGWWKYSFNDAVWMNLFIELRNNKVKTSVIKDIKDDLFFKIGNSDKISKFDYFVATTLACLGIFEFVLFENNESEIDLGLAKRQKENIIVNFSQLIRNVVFDENRKINIKGKRKNFYLLLNDPMNILWSNCYFDTILSAYPYLGKFKDFLSRIKTLAYTRILYEEHDIIIELDSNFLLGIDIKIIGSSLNLRGIGQMLPPGETGKPIIKQEEIKEKLVPIIEEMIKRKESEMS